MAKLKTEIKEIIQRTHNVKSFRCVATEDVDFTAGQYMQVTLKVNDKEITKYLSISSSPTEKGYYEFTKKITDSSFSKTLDHLAVNDFLTVELPEGSFTLKVADKKVAFLSGGIGITPIHSMIKFATDKALEIDMVLLYGNQTEENIVFREELDDMAQKGHHLKVVYTLDKDPGHWPGHIGLIDADMIKEEIPDYEQRIFFLCGPPKMVKSLKKILEEDVKVDADTIRIENFSGY